MFENARYEDPHFGFTNFTVWGAIDAVGWASYNRAGLVERWLYKHSVSPAEYAARVALRCLWRLQREVPVEGGNERGREGILEVLRESLDTLG